MEKMHKDAVLWSMNLLWHTNGGLFVALKTTPHLGDTLEDAIRCHAAWLVEVTFLCTTVSWSVVERHIHTLHVITHTNGTH